MLWFNVSSTIPNVSRESASSWGMTQRTTVSTNIIAARHDSRVGIACTARVSPMSQASTLELSSSCTRPARTLRAMSVRDWLACAMVCSRAVGSLATVLSTESSART
jgi:hypothetical protein